MSELEATPERLTTEQTDQIMTEHLHRYAIAAKYVRNKVVLDIASGEGYGSNLLTKVAKFVYGVDISNEAVAHATKKYPKRNLRFVQGNAAMIPLDDDSVDVIISFETIEHHSQHDEMMLECKRVLRPSGLLIISSPDKKNYSDAAGYSNPYHIKELYEQEFKDLIKKYFTAVTFLRQKFLTASIILSDEGPKGFGQFSGTFGKVHSSDKLEPLYHIAFASNETLPQVSDSVFEQPIINSSNNEEAVAKRYTDSTTWKIGRIILAPFLFFKHIFIK